MPWAEFGRNAARIRQPLAAPFATEEFGGVSDARDYIRIVVGMHKRRTFLCGKLQCVSIGLIVGIAMGNHDRATRLYCLHFDLRCGNRHHNGCTAMKPLRRKRHPLRMVAGGSCHHTTLEHRGGKLDHFIVGPAQFE